MKLYGHTEAQANIIAETERVLCPSCYRVLPVSEEKRGQILIAGHTYASCAHENILVRVWVDGDKVCTQTEAQYITELLRD